MLNDGIRNLATVFFTLVLLSVAWIDGVDDLKDKVNFEYF